MKKMGPHQSKTENLSAENMDVKEDKVKKAADGIFETGPSSTSLQPVEVNSLTEHPHQLYMQLSETKTWKTNYKVLPSLPAGASKPQGHVRFVCISDTHNRHEKVDLPDGDVLLHAGDFTWDGKQADVENFCKFLQSVSHKYKHIIVIAGNHELTFDNLSGAFFGLIRKKADFDRGSKFKDILKKHCFYLEDEEIEVMGFRIYGSPWQPYHRGWAFNLPRGEPLLEKWNQIPDGIDILMTHGPPLGHGDVTFMRRHVGCAELLTTIQQRVKPKLNVFGHIHEGHGITTDGTTIYVNAAICTFRYQPTQAPIIIDLPAKTDS